MAVTVSPGTFTVVSFDAGAIGALAEEVARRLGLPDDLAIEIDVDEGSILTRASLLSVAPVVRIAAAGGAFEDRSRPRHFDEATARIELSRLLTRVADRRSPAFAGAPDETALTPEQELAWDASALGRAARSDDAVHQPRHRYDFQLRFGFAPEADAAFDRLWSSTAPSWPEIEAAVDAASAAR